MPGIKLGARIAANEKKRRRNRQYYLKNKEKILTRQCAQKNVNSEAIKLQQKKYLKTDAGKASNHRKRVKWVSANPEKRKAHEWVKWALKKEFIYKPETCSMCSSSKPQAHHFDYNKPEWILWVCAKCHRKIHKLWNPVKS